MDIKNFNLAVLNTFEKDWALVTAGEKGNFNTMTIGWGGLGTIWGRPVATVYVRPTRYTYEFMERNEYFSISFYDEKYKKDLGVLGSRSGRDSDKVALTNLTPEFLKHTVSFKQANLTLVCKKIYYQDLDQTKIPADVLDKFYQTDGIHRMYIGEVVDIIDKR